MVVLSKIKALKHTKWYNRVFFDGVLGFATNGFVLCTIDFGDCVKNDKTFSIPLDNLPKYEISDITESTMMIDTKEVYFYQLHEFRDWIPNIKSIINKEWSKENYYKLDYTFPKINCDSKNSYVRLYDDKIVVEYNDDDEVVGEYGDVNNGLIDNEANVDFVCALYYFNMLKNTKCFYLRQSMIDEQLVGWFNSGGYDYYFVNSRRFVK